MKRFYTLLLCFLLHGALSAEQLVNIVSMNLGASRLDQQMILRCFAQGVYDDLLCEQEGSEKLMAFDKDRENLEGEYAIKIIEGASVVVLQEVGTKERAFINVLESNGFKIFHFDDPEHGGEFDTAIALKISEFEVQEAEVHAAKHLPSKRDYTIVKAQHNSGHTFTFASLHTPGFNFATMDAHHIDTGDKYCADIAALIKKMAGDSYVVVGADMNSQTDISDERFKKMTRLGLELFQPGEATHLYVSDNPGQPSVEKRKLDYFFAGSPKGILRKLTSWWPRTSLIKAKIDESQFPQNQEAFLDSFYKDEKLTNFSDHLPIRLTVTIADS